MRIYVTIWAGEKDIKLQQIRFDNRNIGDHKKPEIFIRIHKKYKEYFMRPQLIKLHDRHRKTLFLAMESRLNFRCYESDIDDFKGIEIVARYLRIPGIGLPSKHYIQKLLMNVCNAKFVRHIPSKKEIREEQKREAMIKILKERDAPRKKMEYRLRMRRFPVFLKRITYYGYFLRIVVKNRLVFKNNVCKALSIILDISASSPP